MNTSMQVKRIGCWLIFTVTAASLRGAEVTIDLPMAEPLVVAYSPSGEQIAIGGLALERNGAADGVVALIDTTTGKLQSLLRHADRIGPDSSGIRNSIRAVAYSPDGKVLAVAAELGLKLWEPRAGNELVTLFGYGIHGINEDESPYGRLGSIAFSPNSELLAAINMQSSFDTLQLWSVAKRELILQESAIGIRGETRHVAFWPDDTMLITTGRHGYGSVVLWRVADGQQLAKATVKGTSHFGLAVDRQGKHIAAVGAGIEQMWRIEPTDSGGWRFVEERTVLARSSSGIGGADFVRGFIHDFGFLFSNRRRG